MEEESIMLSSFINIMNSVTNQAHGRRKTSNASASSGSVDGVGANGPADVGHDLRALRMDWFRIQALGTSSNRRSFQAREHKDLAYHLNCVAFHSRLIDDAEALISEVSDLSDYCFYPHLFEEQFHLCLEFPAQTRFIIAFPLICAHFIDACHELCPEERRHIGERGLSCGRYIKARFTVAGSFSYCHKS